MLLDILRANQMLKQMKMSERNSQREIEVGRNTKQAGDPLV